MTTDTITATDTVAAPVAAPQAASDEQIPRAESSSAELQTQDATPTEPAPQDTLTPEQRAARKMQRRIDTLTAGRGAAQREAQLWRERAEAAEAARQQPAQADDEPSQRQTDPREFDALVTQRAEQLARQQGIARQVQTVLKAGSSLDGFDDAVNTVADEVPFTDSRGRPTAFIEAVLDSENPAALLHHLGQNPEEAAEYAGLTPAQIGRRIARLEDKLAASAKRQISKAPAPLKPGSGGAPSGGPSDNDSVDAWVRKERLRVSTRAAA